MFGAGIWIVAGLAVLVIGGAWELRRRHVRRQKAEGGWDKLYPLW